MAAANPPKLQLSQRFAASQLSLFGPLTDELLCRQLKMAAAQPQDPPINDRGAVQPLPSEDVRQRQIDAAAATLHALARHSGNRRRAQREILTPSQMEAFRRNEQRVSGEYAAILQRKEAEARRQRQLGSVHLAVAGLLKAKRAKAAVAAHNVGLPAAHP